MQYVEIYDLRVAAPPAVTIYAGEVVAVTVVVIINVVVKGSLIN